MKRVSFILGIAVWLFATSAYGQGTFQNLDFESAVIVPVPGDVYNRVDFAAAFPGWTGYLGTIQQRLALYNNFFTGTATIGILDANSLSVIEGNYSAVLQAGDLGGHVSAAIAQTGLIPVGAESIQLQALPVLVNANQTFGVSIGGQDIPMFPLSSTTITNLGTVTTYGGDISAFAGLTEELRIAALSTAASPFSNWIFDNIQFSDQAVPEPGAFAFGLLGAALFAVRRWRNSKG